MFCKRTKVCSNFSAAAMAKRVVGGAAAAVSEVVLRAGHSQSAKCGA